MILQLLSRSMNPDNFLYIKKLQKNKKQKIRKKIVFTYCTKWCTCVYSLRYSLSNFVKDELMCREKESHKSHVNHIPWLGLTFIMIDVERGGGRREKGSYYAKNWLLTARVPLSPVFCACHAGHAWTIGHWELTGIGFRSVNAQQYPMWQIVIRYCQILHEGNDWVNLSSI